MQVNAYCPSRPRAGPNTCRRHCPGADDTGAPHARADGLTGPPLSPAARAPSTGPRTCGPPRHRARRRQVVEGVGEGALSAELMGDVASEAKDPSLASTRRAAGAALSARSRASSPKKAPPRVRGVLTSLFAPAAPACGTSRPGRTASGASHAQSASRWRCPGLQLWWRPAGGPLAGSAKRNQRLQKNATPRRVRDVLRGRRGVHHALGAPLKLSEPPPLGGGGGTTSVCSPCSLHPWSALTTHRLAASQPASLVSRPR